MNGRGFLPVYIGIACLVLMAPIVIVCVLAFSGQGYLRFPPESLSLRWFAAFFGDGRWRQSLWSSTMIALIACAISTVLGFFAAYALVRSDMRAKKMMLSFMLLPIIIPHVITAIAMYFLTARFGLVGNVVWIGLCHAVVALPVVLLILLSAMQAVDLNLERAAPQPGREPRTRPPARRDSHRASGHPLRGALRVPRVLRRAHHRALPLGRAGADPAGADLEQPAS